MNRGSGKSRDGDAQGRKVEAGEEWDLGVVPIPPSTPTTPLSPPQPLLPLPLSGPLPLGEWWWAEQ